MLGGVTEEDAPIGARGQLMGSDDIKVEVAGAPEELEVRGHRRKW
jgi:hypothetical protein